MKKYIEYRFIFFSLAICIGTAACEKKNDIDWYRPIGEPLSAYVKYVNAIPASNLDFYTYYTKQTVGVLYGKDQPYVNSPFGNIVVYATNANQTTNRITAVTSSATPQMNGQGLWADKYQTMLACKATDSTNADAMILLRDDLTAPAAGTAHIRFVNLVQRGSSKYKVVDFTTISGPKSPEIIFSGLPYQVPSNAIRIDPGKGLATPGLGVYTSGPFSAIAAGTYDFEVKATDGSQTVAIKNGVVVEEGKIYTFYSSGTIGGAVLPTIQVLTHSINSK